MLGAQLLELHVHGTILSKKYDQCEKSAVVNNNNCV